MIIKKPRISGHGANRLAVIFTFKQFSPSSVCVDAEHTDRKDKYQAEEVKYRKQEDQKLFVPNSASFKLQCVWMFSCAGGSSCASGMAAALAPFASRPAVRSASSMTL